MKPLDAGERAAAVGDDEPCEDVAGADCSCGERLGRKPGRARYDEPPELERCAWCGCGGGPRPIPKEGCCRWSTGACCGSVVAGILPEVESSFFLSSACTSMPSGASFQHRPWHTPRRFGRLMFCLPFSRRMRSSSEFLYRSIRHSSAAERWLCCRFCSVSSWCLMVVSSCLMYSVRRSRKAAWACRLRCFRSSEVAYICFRCQSVPCVCFVVAACVLLFDFFLVHREATVHVTGPKVRAAHTGLRPPLRFWTGAFGGGETWPSPSTSPSMSGEDSMDDSESSRECSRLGMTGDSASGISHPFLVRRSQEAVSQRSRPSGSPLSTNDERLVPGAQNGGTGCRRQPPDLQAFTI